MRYVITVDRSLLESDPSNPRVIRVEDTFNGGTFHYTEVSLLPTRDGAVPVIRSGPPRQDGARVWIECGRIEAT